MTITMHIDANIAGPVRAGLGQFTEYRPYRGLPFRLRRAWRSISAITINAHMRTHNSI